MAQWRNRPGRPATTVVDAELSRAFSAAYGIAPGVKNQFDRQPDRRQFAGLSSDYSADLPSNCPAGNGGSYHVRLGVNL